VVNLSSRPAIFFSEWMCFIEAQGLSQSISYHLLKEQSLLLASKNAAALQQRGSETIFI